MGSGKGRFAVRSMLVMLAATALVSASVGCADATQICAWLVESNQPDDVRQLDLWLQSDADIDFLIKVDGDGIIDGSGKSNSPESATYSLTGGQADKAWGFGATLAPPGAIDEIVELHETPADISSDAPTPLLARFAFQRKIPAGETTPPDTLAKKQCETLK
jgi:hypothetical protein